MAQFCSVDECTNLAVKRGWCQTHYTRWHRHGDPTFTKMEMHGLHKRPEYAIWVAMKDRCHNPNNEYYYLYGGRGISVCAEWKSSFLAFYTDMGPKPDGFSIERRNNNLGYMPSNCIWVTPKVQAQNRRTNHLVEYRGRTQAVSQWCDELGIEYSPVITRINMGWDVERALHTPIRRRG